MRPMEEREKVEKEGKSNEKMFIESIARRSEARPCASKGLAAM